MEKDTNIELRSEALRNVIGQCRHYLCVSALW